MSHLGTALLVLACGGQVGPFVDWVPIPVGSAPALEIERLVDDWDNLQPLAADTPADRDRLWRKLASARSEWQRLSSIAVDPRYRPGGAYHEALDAEFAAVGAAQETVRDSPRDAILSREESLALTAVIGYESKWLTYALEPLAWRDASASPRASLELVLDGNVRIPVVVATGLGDPIQNPLTGETSYAAYQYCSLIRGDMTGVDHVQYLHCLHELALVIRSLDKLRTDHDLVEVRVAVERWENRLLDGYYQYPWELLVNGALVDSTWDDPSRFQWVFLHPELGMAFSPSRDGGTNPQPALVLHGVGTVWYLGNEFEGYLGLTASGAMAEDIGFGYGVSILAGHSKLRSRGVPGISVGLQRFEDTDDTYVTIGLEFFKSSAARDVFELLQN